jgi:hypothetical protein
MNVAACGDIVTTVLGVYFCTLCLYRKLLLLLLTPYLYVAFGRLHQIIPGSSLFNEPGAVINFRVPLISFGVCFGRLQNLPGSSAVQFVALTFTRLGR